MQILGHSQISLTLGTYSHVVTELALEAAPRMEEALWGPKMAPKWHHAREPRKTRNREAACQRGCRPVGRVGLEPTTEGL